jgi:isoquinoline 1-oxidoreductase beta subunit
MEPLNCTALVDRDRCTLWSPCQFPNLAASGVADALGIPAERVRVHVTRMGGGFGRRINADYAIEAALV